MKTSTIFITILSIVIIAGLFMSNTELKKEYLKIDLSDPYKNYVSVAHKPYTVLDISGSNGYPIQIVQKETNDIKVLRSRLNHFESELKQDTLCIKFTGSNIPPNQRYNSTTPYGIIIAHKGITSIISADTHNRVFGFKNDDLQITLKGNSFMEVNDCNLGNLNVKLEDTSYIDFISNNTADSLDLNMKDTSVASLQKLNTKTIHHVLKDSVTIILSKETFNTILKY